MSKEEIKELKKFLSVFPKEQQEIALWLREFVWELYPNCNELIYDNYNALAFGWSPTSNLGQTFCSVAVFTNGIHFGFYRGVDLADPERKLQGKGNQYRFIRVTNRKEFPKNYIKKLLKEAFANSMLSVKDPKDIMKGKTIVKSISKKKKRPGM